MLLPPPSSTRTDTPCPDSTLVRSRYADHATNQGGGTGAGTAATRAIDRRIQRRWGLRLEGGERMDGFGEADALLGAAETRRADADRPVALTDVAKADCRAVGVRLREIGRAHV